MRRDSQRFHQWSVKLIPSHDIKVGVRCQNYQLHGMKFNKKTALLLAVALAGLGSLGSIAAQSFAQTSSVNANQSPVIEKTGSQANLGVSEEQPTQESANTEGEKGSVNGEVKEKDVPGIGHQDPNGINVNHEFNGAE